MAKEESPQVAPEEFAEPSGKKKVVVMALVLLGVMLAEGAGVFFLARKLAGPPASANAAQQEGLNPDEGQKAPKDIEVELVKVRAQNEQSQQVLVYDMTVVAVISEKDAERVNELLQRKKATLQDRFSRVIRSLDPQRFTEPELSTIRQQFKHELSQVIGDEETAKEILIPALTRYNEN